MAERVGTPIITGRCGVYLPCGGLVVTGNYCFLTRNRKLFQPVDISNPTHPDTLPSILVSEPCHLFRLAISGNHAYVLGCRGLYAIDITNPRAPVEVGSAHHGNLHRGDIKIYGNYIITGYSSASISPLSVYGIEIFGIANASDPTYISSLEIADDSTCDDYFEPQIEISGDTAYISPGKSATWHCQIKKLFHVVDISNPSSPILVYSYPTTSESAFQAIIALSGDELYAQVSTKGTRDFSSYSVTSPTSPTFLDDYNYLVYPPYFASLSPIMTFGDDIYLFNRKRTDEKKALMYWGDITNPNDLNVQYLTDLLPSIAFGEIDNYTVAGDYLFAITRNLGGYVDSLFIIKINNHPRSLAKSTHLANLPNSKTPLTCFTSSDKLIANVFLDKPSKVKLTLYNILGMQVKTLADEFLLKGETHFEWYYKDIKANSIVSGFYILVLQTDSKRYTQKVLLLK